jgi:hypothetical protein
MALSEPAGATGQPSVQVGRMLSEAPTVMTFLAFPGVPMVPSGWRPLLPAEKMKVIDWFPGLSRSASRTPTSYAWDDSSYSWAQVLQPQELLLMRPPAV